MCPPQNPSLKKYSLVPSVFSNQWCPKRAQEELNFKKKWFKVRQPQQHIWLLPFHWDMCKLQYSLPICDSLSGRNVKYGHGKAAAAVTRAKELVTWGAVELPKPLPRQSLQWIRKEVLSIFKVKCWARHALARVFSKSMSALLHFFRRKRPNFALTV